MSDTTTSDGPRLAALAKDELESLLPAGVGKRGEGERRPEDVVVGTVVDADRDAAFAEMRRGAGGELRETKNGNFSFCSAESSALMAVNFLAPFRRRPGLFGRPQGQLSFERRLRVTGVKGWAPSLDAVLETEDETVAIECKLAEPWRKKRPAEVQAQYDAPLGALSEGAAALADDLRRGATPFVHLEAAQLLKHLLGLHSATGGTSRSGELVLVYWKPSRPGRFAPLFAALERELDDFAARVDDGPVDVRRCGTDELLAAWRASEHEWLREHAAALAERYDAALPDAEAD